MNLGRRPLHSGGNFTRTQALHNKISEAAHRSLINRLKLKLTSKKGTPKIPPVVRGLLGLVEAERVTNVIREWAGKELVEAVNSAESGIRVAKIHTREAHAFFEREVNMCVYGIAQAKLQFLNGQKTAAETREEVDFWAGVFKTEISGTGITIQDEKLFFKKMNALIDYAVELVKKQSRAN